MAEMDQGEGGRDCNMYIGTSAQNHLREVEATPHLVLLDPGLHVEETVSWRPKTTEGNTLMILTTSVP